mgnify:CR=1 FL=1
MLNYISLNINYLRLYLSQLISVQGTPQILEYAHLNTFWSNLLLFLLNSISLVAKYNGYTLSQTTGILVCEVVIDLSELPSVILVINFLLSSVVICK